MPIRSDKCATPGQAIYTRPVLAAYDLFVLRFSNRFIWRCPWPRMLGCAAPFSGRA